MGRNPPSISENPFLASLASNMPDSQFFIMDILFVQTLLKLISELSFGSALQKPLIWRLFSMQNWNTDVLKGGYIFAGDYDDYKEVRVHVKKIDGVFSCDVFAGPGGLAI